MILMIFNVFDSSFDGFGVDLGREWAWETDADEVSAILARFRS